jgi:WhiB family transcriptional regulator, redox-sensing transcriptional regulator
MVDSRTRRRTLRRASLGIGTPCQTRTPELFFPAGERSWVDADHPGAYDLARRLCASCQSRQWCLTAALAHHESYGMWGGTTPAERARILLDRRTSSGGRTNDPKAPLPDLTGIEDDMARPVALAGMAKTTTQRRQRHG